MNSSLEKGKKRKGMYDMDLTTLQRQHNEIGAQVKEIEMDLTAANVSTNAFDISMKISRLAGLISIHLKTEDEHLYPNLKAQQDEKVKRIAEQFSREMGGIAKAFSEYKNTYRISSNIKANPEKFIKDTTEILKALKKRVSNEDSVLYPLLK